MNTEIMEALERANGRRRTRTMDVSDVQYVIDMADEHGHHGRHGGNVPNSYGYPAKTTRAWAIRDGDYVWLRIEEVNALGVRAIAGGERSIPKHRAEIAEHPERFIRCEIATVPT